jgi:adenylate cyclase
VRKLATILCADIVGYSRLIGVDEEGTIGALKSQRGELTDPIIARHGGRIVKTMGDGILVEFPSPVEAVRSAIEIQQGVTRRAEGVTDDRRIFWRIGINLGDVVTEGNDLLGDGVNIAARLENLAEAGGICVSRTIRDQVRDRLAVSFMDLGEQHVKNIVRPVRCFRLTFDDYVASTPAQGASHIVTSRPRLSIIVLPFENLSGDPEQGYFADGLTEDITTDLSRISGSFVIARSTAFTYKGKPVDVRAVAQEVGVRYILEGSVRRLGSQVRINVQLIDGETGGHLWTDRLDHDIRDLGAIQDEVTRHIAQALNLELIDAESRSSKRTRPNNPDAVDLAMQGWSVLNQSMNADRLRKARHLFEASLAKEERLVTSLVGLANTIAAGADLGRGSGRPLPEETLDRARELLDTALALDPKMAAAYRVRAWLLSYHDRLLEAVAAAETALALNRNDSVAHALLGLLELQLGNSKRSREVIQQAIRLSPRDPNLWFALQVLARAQIALGESDEALITLDRAITANPDETFFRVFIATAHGRMGRDTEAREAIAEFLRLNPNLMSDQSEASKGFLRAQLELCARGYYIGTIDNVAGPFFERALTAFQRDQGIAETGKLDETTIAKLDMKGIAENESQRLTH